MKENINISNITFSDDLERFSGENILLATMPENIKNKDHLFNIYLNKLKLPDYFGRNWDALDEILHDFYWVKQKTIIIAHEGIPLGLKEEDLKIYLEILSDAVQVWKDSPREGFEPPQIMHELIVVFPSNCKQQIEEILARHD